MRASIHWFSGSGNSWLAATRLAERLRGGGAEVGLLAMEDALRPAASQLLPVPEYQ